MVSLMSGSRSFDFFVYLSYTLPIPSLSHTCNDPSKVIPEGVEVQEGNSVECSGVPDLEFFSHRHGFVYLRSNLRSSLATL
jgi:hypothetical protein